MVYEGGRTVDCIIIFKDKMLAVIYPLAGDACLNKIEYRP